MWTFRAAQRRPTVTALVFGHVVATRIFGGHPPESRLTFVDLAEVETLASVITLRVAAETIDSMWVECWLSRQARCLTMTDPYSALGLSPTATQAEITHAYSRHLCDHHPDIRSRESNSGADERLRQILEAYALLRDRIVAPPTTALIPPTKKPDRSRYQ